MNDFINYYELLGIDKNASKEEINKAYRMQAKKWHPDVSKEANASTIMNKLNEAKEILLDEVKRGEYDSLLEEHINPKYQKFNREQKQYTEYREETKTYTKWEYFKEYLKYYKVSKFRKIIAFILVMLESLLCGVLQLINYLLAYITYTLGGLISYIATIILGLIFIMFIVDLSTNSNMIVHDNNILRPIIYMIILIIVTLLPNILFKVLVVHIPNFLSKLNINLFKLSVGYKEL